MTIGNWPNMTRYGNGLVSGELNRAKRIQPVRFKVLTETDLEPVTVEEAQSFAKIEFNSENDLLTSFIKAARRQAEIYTARAFLNKTLEVWLDSEPLEDVIELPLSPLVSLQGMAYFVDGSSVEAAFDLTNIILDTVSEPGRVALINGMAWPTGLRNVNAFVFRCTIGYGATANTIPEDIKTAIKITVQAWYDSRGDMKMGVGNVDGFVIPTAALQLLNNYAVKKL